MEFQRVNRNPRGKKRDYTFLSVSGEKKGDGPNGYFIARPRRKKARGFRITTPQILKEPVNARKERSSRNFSSAGEKRRKQVSFVGRIKNNKEGVQRMEQVVIRMEGPI